MVRLGRNGDTTIMNQPVAAAIHIQGSFVRCAEVVRRDSELEVLRCSDRSFDFDVARALWDESEGETAIEEVGVALQDELKGTEADEMSLVVHPLNAFTFFTPMSTALSERERMRRVIQQVSLLSGARSADALRITPHVVRTETAGDDEVLEWIHVLALPNAVQARVEGLISFLPVQDRIRMVSTEAAAMVMAAVEGTASAPDSTEDGRYSLALGQYPTHTEYSLLHQGDWYHGHAVAETRPGNRSYYAVGFLNRLGVSLHDIRRVFLYGTKREVTDTGDYAALFGTEPTLLNPFEIFGLEVEDGGEQAVAEFVPCIGALLESVAG